MFSLLPIERPEKFGFSAINDVTMKNGGNLLNEFRYSYILSLLKVCSNGLSFSRSRILAQLN
jgi:hypothetical protein